MVQFTRCPPTRKKLLSMLLVLCCRELGRLTQVHRLPDLIKRAKRFLDRFSIFPIFLSTVLFLSFLAIRRPIIIIQFQSCIDNLLGFFSVSDLRCRMLCVSATCTRYLIFNMDLLYALLIVQKSYLFLNDIFWALWSALDGCGVAWNCGVACERGRVECQLMMALLMALMLSKCLLWCHPNRMIIILRYLMKVTQVI